MNAADFYRKTMFGIEELRAPRRKLRPKLRAMLILVDANKTVAALEEEARMIGAPGDFLEQLRKANLIAPGTVLREGRMAGPASVPPAGAQHDDKPVHVSRTA